jgi:transcriptional regulator with XRE-family HTH domain
MTRFNQHRGNNYARVPRLLLFGSVLWDVVVSPMLPSILVAAAVVCPVALIFHADISTPEGMLTLVAVTGYFYSVARFFLTQLASATPDKTTFRSDRYNPAQWSAVRKWSATEDASMGGWLRRVREERGVPLTTIAYNTMISERYLQAIERDRFEVLPNGPQRRSWLRQYAEELGLDPARVIALFDDYVAGPKGAIQLAAVVAVPAAIADMAPVPSRILPVAGPPLSHRCARAVFDLLEAVLPKRLAREELGDALEYIARLPRGGWRVWTKIASTVIWTSVNAIRELASVPWGRRTSD